MELCVKDFYELTLDELYEIYKLRVDVFVVEQQCPYHEIDAFDRAAKHIFFRDEEGILSYLRVLPQNTAFDEVSIGRVIAVKRRMGLGSKTVAEGIRVAREEFNARCIVIEAQTYARGLYEKQGFVQTSEEFYEDGIPHIKMRLEL